MKTPRTMTKAVNCDGRSTAEHQSQHIKAEHVILDYVAACEAFGPMDFAMFVEGWREADAFARTILSEELV